MSRLKGKSDRFIAALAVRENSINIIEEGIDSVLRSNSIDDYRDVICALVLYYDAIKRIGHDPEEFFKSYIDINMDKKKYLEPFLLRSQDDKKLNIGGFKVIYNPEFNYDYEL